MVDKNQAVIDYLLQCPVLQGDPVFFNCVKAESDNKQIVTLANDKTIDKAYVDGSVNRRYTFTIVDFRSVTFNPLISTYPGQKNQNVEELLDVQGIIDWITEQDNNRNFPDFGEDILVESIKSVTTNPNLSSVDTTGSPGLAKYTISIQIDYLDSSNKLWNK